MNKLRNLIISETRNNIDETRFKEQTESSKKFFENRKERKEMFGVESEKSCQAIHDKII